MFASLGYHLLVSPLCTMRFTSAVSFSPKHIRTSPSRAGSGKIRVMGGEKNLSMNLSVAFSSIKSNRGKFVNATTQSHKL